MYVVGDMGNGLFGFQSDIWLQPLSPPGAEGFTTQEDQEMLSRIEKQLKRRFAIGSQVSEHSIVQDFIRQVGKGCALEPGNSHCCCGNSFPGRQLQSPLVIFAFEAVHREQHMLCLWSWRRVRFFFSVRVLGFRFGAVHVPCNTW